MGFAPSGLLMAQGRLHLQLRVQLLRHLDLGATLFNPAYTLFRATNEEAAGWRWALLSGLELRVFLQ